MSIDRPPRPVSSTQHSGDSGTSPITAPLERFIGRLPKESVIPLSGGLAGAVAGVVSCPLDVIKTKLQAQGGFQGTRGGLDAPSIAYRGVAGSASTIWREDGLRGMYRGLGPMLLGYIPTWAVYLTVYNKSQAFFRTRTGECSLPSGAAQPAHESARELVRGKCICFFDGWRLFNNGNKPNLGHQDEINVSIKLPVRYAPFPGPVVLQEHLGRCAQDVFQ